MKVFLAIPCYDGKISYRFLESYTATLIACGRAGIQVEYKFWPGCCYIDLARNKLVQEFLKTDCTDFLFIDSDMAWIGSDVVKILQAEPEMVAGLYPFKVKEESYPTQVITNDDMTPHVENGLIELTGAPTGFLRIRRSVFEKFISAFPERATLYANEDGSIEKCHTIFKCEQIGNKWWGEDYNFSREWRDMGGRIWALPDMDFLHIGNHEFSGNYHKYMMKQPKAERPL